MDGVDGRLLGLICVPADACSAADDFDFGHEIISKSFLTHEDGKAECVRESACTRD